MKILIALIMVASAAWADTWTMTNGVPISGTVVSSQVACVWIKTPLGVVRQIPVDAFDWDSCERLPQDAAGIYCRFIRQYRASGEYLELAQKATDKYCELDADTKRRMANLSISLESTSKRMAMLIAELDAWREANSVADATPRQRQAFVDEQVGKASADILRAQ